MTPNVFDTLAQNATLGILVSFLIQYLKDSPYFPFLQRGWKKVNFFAVGLSTFLTSMGVTQNWDPITGDFAMSLNVYTVGNQLWNWLQTWATAQLIYKKKMGESPVVQITKGPDIAEVEEAVQYQMGLVFGKLKERMQESRTTVTMMIVLLTFLGMGCAARTTNGLPNSPRYQALLDAERASVAVEGLVEYLVVFEAAQESLSVQRLIPDHVSLVLSRSVRFINKELMAINREFSDLSIPARSRAQRLVSLGDAIRDDLLEEVRGLPEGPAKSMLTTAATALQLAVFVVRMAVDPGSEAPERYAPAVPEDRLVVPRPPARILPGFV